MPRKRTTYTAEFKLQAVRMTTDQKLSVAEVARRLDVGESLLRTWKQAFLERGSDSFPGHGNPATADDGGGAPRGGERPPAGRAGPAKKSRRLLRQPAGLTYRFIADHQGQWPVTWMCEALEVSASGYYAWAARPDSPTWQWRE